MKRNQLKTAQAEANAVDDGVNYSEIERGKDTQKTKTNHHGQKLLALGATCETTILEDKL